MKIIDCVTYYNEPLLYELRLNILSKYIDKFIVIESMYTHSGERKKINFEINNYPKYKNKITHMVIDHEPDNLKFPNKDFKRYNSIKRIEYQRDYIKNISNEIDKKDWIIYSDSDEIPNLTKINFKKSDQKIIFFKQNLFYYKFNLILENQPWFGSRACRYKDLISISQLRVMKPKVYNWWRIDTFFKKNKLINTKIIEHGGWHFSDLKSVKDILKKKQNDEHHDEFEISNIDEQKIRDMVQNRYISYDHSVDKKKLNQKWHNKIMLSVVNNNMLPKYLLDNKKKYLKWFD